jgi:DNA-binding CsgD family transcriptional regulator
MRPNDVEECVSIVAAHPIAGPRYARGIADLGPAWHRLLAADGFCAATVFEDTAGTAVTTIGVGVSVFVSDIFAREVKESPYFWIGPELAKRVVRGQPAVLSPREVLAANSGRGLNLLIWQASVRREDAQRMEVWNALMTAGVEQHRGYLLKEVFVAQAESIDHLLGLRHTGGFLWDGSRGCYGDVPQDDLHDIIRKPHVLGVTREIAQQRPLESITSMIGSLFVYRPPQFGFSRSEQRLLLAALHGGTDRELSDALGISLATVKKTWRSIYDRVATRSPDLIPSTSATDGDEAMPERGREKKHPLIAYLRQHPEELRPVSRKLLRGNAVVVP